MRTLITTKGAHHQPTLRTIKDHLARCETEGFWLDIEAPDDEDYAILEKGFGFHHLSVEDIRHRNQRPKLEEFKGYAFLVLFQAEVDRAHEVKFIEHHGFLAKDYLVTIHEDASPELNELRDRIDAEPDLTKGDPGFLTYLVVDVLVDSLFPVLERLDEHIDQLQDDILAHATPELLGEITRMKHDVIELRKYLGAQRDMFQRLITHSLNLHQQDLTLYWRDVLDHLVRQYETVDSLRDLLTSAMDVYLSTVSNRLNVTMKALTVIASVFLPISFLTGFYGMNFAFLTGVLEPPYWSFFVGVGTMVAAVVIQLWFFRRRGWL
ncbi:MAG TPA: magnesium/cobalt transporter CorA [Candidatus Dormibacteraeota bacterium]